MVKKVEITHKTIVFTVFFLFVLWFLYFIRDILFQVLISFVIMSSFNPFVTRLEKRGLSRVLGTSVAYIIFLGVVGFTVYVLAPALVTETGSFVKNVPEYIARIGLPVAFKEQILEQMLIQLGQLPSQLAKTTISVFSNVINVITILILSFYLLLAREKFDGAISNFFGDKKADSILLLISKIESKIGGWAKAEVFLMLLVGSFTYLGLLLLHVPYALPLAILAGLFEIVPMVGPFVAAIPAIVIGFSTSSFTGIATASLVFLIQQVENYIFVPKVMQKSAGVNPVVTLITLSVGFRIQGITGAIIAIPVILALQVVVEEYISKKRLPDTEY
ncbi:MAG: hypothetical protein US75_C0007G0068 [Candidatus Woesebacteria bacterium GW2011_GWC1_38_13]|uniref:Permease n=3 Tax=Candidatus Woeseibacteriota TaxID=1752722 RepID=A0A0G0NDQ2_9BACT|nr:MAG: hypothetical protein US67_C0019G0004 [Candidatus Woesebacteria bacterium GW2011_GWD1_38_10]KKQ56362.1 MAG: hypothetical protein US75_C0007G0068 [Candidatus Woesebacteria bacterium GW2011_GWC1_38_13]KKQ84034.1 MAG: hypothetical protein UT06_C0011G0023 [Candidatus Woesebacteria bacterium GW2011_GWA1_38_8]